MNERLIEKDLEEAAVAYLIYHDCISMEGSRQTTKTSARIASRQRFEPRTS
jgi:hypothetical protein